MQAPLYESTLSQFPLLARGKVRDMYAVDDDRLLIVTTDRLSAFDVVLEDPIPGKGKVLNQMTEFWLKKLHDIVPNHSLNCPLETVIQDRNDLAVLQGRSMVVKRLQPILVEAVVRGYLVGSGWKEYQQSQSVCGIALPAGMRLADKLPEPIFTPAAKAEVGAHDENIAFAQMEKMIGSALAQQIRTISLQLYAKAAEYAATKGIIIADTKFEFGLDQQGTLYLMDEVLTPDSSRFWPADAYTVGENPPSYDKQFVRDWLESQPWNKTAPAPKLPTDVIEKTALKYQEALQVLQANA